jgi:hypothetical protein
MFAFALPALIQCLAKGYHTFTVRYDRQFAVTLSKNMLIFALDEVLPSYVNFTVSNRKNRTTQRLMPTFSNLIFCFILGISV